MLAYVVRMSKIINSLSVFFPAYNEEANLKRSVESATPILKEIAIEWEVLIINDGSSDKTTEIAKELSRNDKRVRVITHKANMGYGEALKSGFKNARYPWVAFMDSDGQFDFSEIKKFIAKTEDADLILGYRLRRADSLLRRIYGFGWSLIAKILLGMTARDYSCGFKLIKKEVFEKVEPLTLGEKVTQIELLVKAQRTGFKFAEVGVHHYARQFGQQTGASFLVTLKSILDLVKLWWKLLNKFHFTILLVILATASFLRLYKIDQYMTFLGDEGRDVILVRRLLVNFDPILVGPGTSIGNMYLGPLYYYLMAPALFLANLSPVGPAVQIAVLGVITVWLVWFIAREWFGKVAGIVASALYAVSPVVIVHSHSSWNPNIMPFFALLSIYSIWRVWRHSEWKWLLVLGVAYAFVLQSHYLGLLLLPTLGIFWLLTMASIWRQMTQRLSYIRYTVYSILIFLSLMSPLVIFDARHGWRNFQAILVFFTKRQETVSLKPWNSIPEIWPVLNEKFITRFVAGENLQIGVVVSVLLILGLIFLLALDRKKLLQSPILLFSTWIFVGLIGLGIYKQNIYDHYFGFMFATPFILLGAIAQQISSARLADKIPNLLIGVGLAFLIGINLVQTPIKYPPQGQLWRTEMVAQKIAQEAYSEPFNLAVLAERNYEDAYQYFLEWWKKPVRDIDPLRYNDTVAEQLFVVCELPKEKCDPTHNPKAEITVFGWSKIDKEWDINGVKLYRLVHNPTGQPQ